MHKIQNLKLGVVFYSIMLFLIPTQVISQKLYTHETGLSSLVFSKQKELKLGLYFHSPEQQGGKLLIGYSPFKNISVEGGFINTNIEFNNLKGKTFSANIGLFKNLQINKHPEREDANYKKADLNTSLKLGYTYGNINSSISVFQSMFEFQKFYAQFGIGVKNRMLGINMFLKYNLVNYIEGEVVRPESNPGLFRNVREIENNKFINMMEYKIRVHCGYGYVKAILGMSFEFNLDNNRNLNFLEQGYPYFGTILELNKIQKLFKKKQNKEPIPNVIN